MPQQDGLAEAVNRVGDRWTLLVIGVLLAGPKRFSDLMSEVQGIAPNILSQRMKRLEQGGLVVAQAYSERPRRFVYELSESGRELGGALRMLSGWGSGLIDDQPRHGTCGTPMEVRWFCPTCNEAVENPAEDDIRYV